MLINYVSYCKAKPKIILIKVKIWKVRAFWGKTKLFPALTR